MTVAQQRRIALVDGTASTAKSRVRTVRTSRSRIGKWGPPLIVAAAIIGVWFFISDVVLDATRRFLLPPPDQVFSQAFFLPDVMSDIATSLGRTAIVTGIGLAISMVLGIAWAVTMSQARWAERSFFPYAVILQCVPILALVPLIGFWFGFDYPARVIVCVMVSLFPMVSNTLFGLQSVPQAQRELFKLQRASRWTVLTKLEFPSALPAIFAGMRISAGLSVVGAVVGDYFFQRGEPGLGGLISSYQAGVQSAPLFATIIVASLFGVVIFLLFSWLGRLAVGSWSEI